jgi:hypothetical protein
VLNLTACTIAKIYTGLITTWDHADIKWVGGASTRLMASTYNCCCVRLCLHSLQSSLVTVQRGALHLNDCHVGLPAKVHLVHTAWQLHSPWYSCLLHISIAGPPTPA